MSAFKSTTNTAGFDRVVIEDERGVGVMVFAFPKPIGTYSKRYVLDTWEEAWAMCRKDWGVPETSWLRTSETPNSS